MTWVYVDLLVAASSMIVTGFFYRRGWLPVARPRRKTPVLSLGSVFDDIAELNLNGEPKSVMVYRCHSCGDVRLAAYPWRYYVGSLGSGGAHDTAAATTAMESRGWGRVVLPGREKGVWLCADHLQLMLASLGVE